MKAKLSGDEEGAQQFLRLQRAIDLRGREDRARQAQITTLSIQKLGETTLTIQHSINSRLGGGLPIDCTALEEGTTKSDGQLPTPSK